MINRTILVVEDERKLNEILCDNLEAAGYKVIPAFDGESALQLFQAHDVDMVLLDIMMPKIDGWSVCRQLRKHSDLIIVIISARSAEDDKLMGYELGADDYIEKPVRPSVLLAKLNVLFARFNRAAHEANVLQLGEICINKEAYIVKVSGKAVELTPKEYELLCTLAENRDKTLSRNRLTDLVWGFDYFGSDRVVDTKIKTLRKKLGAQSDCIRTVFGIGYRFEVKS